MGIVLAGDSRNLEPEFDYHLQAEENGNGFPSNGFPMPGAV